MSFYNSDSISNILTDKLKLQNNITILYFGENLKSRITSKYSDTKTTFPSESILNSKSHDNRVIIVSDGNFKNEEIALNGYKKKELFFLKLKRESYKSFVELNLSSDNNNITAEISGYSLTDDTIMITIPSFINKKITVKKGFFSKKISLKTESLKNGRHILQISTSLKVNKVTVTKEFLYNKFPKKIMVYIQSKYPNLDIKFLKLAIKKDKRFKLTSYSNAEVAILSNFDKIGTKERGMRLTIYTGKDPIFNKELNISNLTNYKLLNEYYSQFLTNNLPQINLIYSQRESTPYKNSLIFSATDSSHKIRPLIIQTKSNEIHIPFSGWWKWCFNNENTENSNFSYFLKSIIIDKYYNTLSSSFLTIIPDTPTEGYSTYLSILPPVDFSDTIYKLEVCLQDSNKKTLKIINDNIEPIQFSKEVILPPLPAGQYQVKTTISDGNKFIKSNKSITVKRSNQEEIPTKQNIDLLNKIGTQLDISNNNVFKKFIASNNLQSYPKIINHEFKFHRSITLLLLFIFLNTLTWIINRKSNR